MTDIHTDPFYILLRELDEPNRMKVLNLLRQGLRLEVMLKEVSRDGEAPHDTLMRLIRQNQEYQSFINDKLKVSINREYGPIAEIQRSRTFKHADDSSVCWHDVHTDEEGTWCNTSGRSSSRLLLVDRTDQPAFYKPPITPISKAWQLHKGRKGGK